MGHAQVLRPAQAHRHGGLLHIALSDFCASVRGAVVHHADLQVGIGLGQDRVQASAQVSLHLIYGNQNGYQWSHRPPLAFRALSVRALGSSIADLAGITTRFA